MASGGRAFLIKERSTMLAQSMRLQKKQRKPLISKS